MGRGNVCVTGAYEGLYYIDNDDFHVYRRDDPHSDDEFESRLLKDLSYQELTGGEWYYCESDTAEEEDSILECFVEGFTKLFPTFRQPEPAELRLKDDGRVLLESKLFYIALEDNEWSLAVKLIQKEDPYDDHLSGLQKQHHQRYLEGMKKALLERLPSIGAYSGAWTHKVITKEEAIA